MFCGLNGITRNPRRLNVRHSPATISDLPTLEPVPCTMMAGGRVLIRETQNSTPGTENPLSHGERVGVRGLCPSVDRASPHPERCRIPTSPHGRGEREVRRAPASEFDPRLRLHAGAEGM